MSWGLEGLDEVTKTLSAMIKARRLPHALLFTGAKGGGKNSLARALAATLNCQAPLADGGPCLVCPSCLKVGKDIHPDVATLGPSGRSNQIKIDDVHDLRLKMGYRPFEGRTKIFIIREADRLGSDAGNALLKTLEEPPPDSVIILTSASEREVMTTIVSRCLRLRLAPLAYGVVLTFLAEQRNLRGPQARLVAALAGGALGPALNLDPEAIWSDWLGLNELMGLTQAPLRLESAWSWVKKEVEREEAGRTLDLLRLWWRETLRLKALGPDGLEGPPPHPAQYVWAERLSSRAVGQMGQAMERLEDSLSRFIKPELAYENYWLKIFSL